MKRRSPLVEQPRRTQPLPFLFLIFMDAESLNPDAVVADAAKVQAYIQSPEAQAILAILEERLAALPQAATLEAKLDQLVPGWKTSEFWMTTLGQVALMLAACDGLLPAKYAALAGALSQVAYSLSRGIAKKGKSN